MIIKRTLTIALLVGGGCVVSGCTPNDISMGAAVRNNNEAQIVEPDPKYTEEMVADGSQVAGAQERYRTGAVKKPVAVKTTTGTGSSKGSGSSGGSSGGNN
jgi:hypothetical protein